MELAGVKVDLFHDLVRKRLLLVLVIGEHARPSRPALDRDHLATQLAIYLQG